MHYVKDLKTILNEYIQLKSKSLAQEELSHTVSLSMGPEASGSEFERIVRRRLSYPTTLRIVK